ncbi:MAG: hypothetical protein PHS36_05625 [Candidatus Cloacimonetes bacterium]|jgi:hypothetical protein|nr:hypothetical protein [Candidatus Cloacimonadota bacterium]
MKINNILSISFIVLITLLPFTAYAGEGNVRVLDKDGNDITKDNIKRISNNSSSKEKDTQPLKTEDNIAGVDAVSDAVTNGGINLGYRIGDEFLKGGFKISSVEVRETKVNDGTMTYSLYSKNINPFEDPSVQKTVIITLLCHLGVVIPIIFLGVCRYVLQTLNPKKAAAISAGFSGDYSQFDVLTFLILCIGVAFMPFIDLAGIWYCLFIRNGMAEFMTQRTLDILVSSSESLPTYLLVNATWYVNNLEKVFGEYAVFTMTKLIVIKSWIQGVTVLFGSLTKAAVLQCAAMIGFILVLVMDISTLFFISSGIDHSITQNNWIYSAAGMVTAATVNGLILICLVGLPVLILYSRIRSGRFGGNI